MGVVIIGDLGLTDGLSLVDRLSFGNGLSLGDSLGFVGRLGSPNHAEVWVMNVVVWYHS